MFTIQGRIKRTLGKGKFFVTTLILTPYIFCLFAELVSKAVEH